MKTFFTLLIGVALGVGLIRGYDWVQDPPPPSEQAQVIIDSMNANTDWRLGKRDNCIVNEKANTVVESVPYSPFVRIKTWEQEKGSNVVDREFGFLDRWHIGKYYDQARRNLEVQKFKCTQNNTSKTATK